jgi:hypothetical protein
MSRIPRAWSNSIDPFGNRFSLQSVVMVVALAALFRPRFQEVPSST